MNIQIFGKPKCFDTKKAERYFKERGIRFQSVNLLDKGMSRGEFNSVKQAVGGLDKLIDGKAKNKELLVLLDHMSGEDKEEKLFENQSLIKTPIVRNGRQAAAGYAPDIWKQWE